MPKIRYVQPSIFMQLYAEAQQWNDGFNPNAPYAVTATQLCVPLVEVGWLEHHRAVEAYHGVDPWSLDALDRDSALRAQFELIELELTVCDATLAHDDNIETLENDRDDNERLVVEATGVILQPMDPTDVVESISEDVPS